jgi:hypothetical protein
MKRIFAAYAEAAPCSFTPAGRSRGEKNEADPAAYAEAAPYSSTPLLLCSFTPLLLPRAD